MALIERDALMKCAFDAFETDGSYIEVVSTEAVLNAPAVDLVRCGSCAHRQIAAYAAPYGIYVCTNYRGLRGDVKENDFCPYGKLPTNFTSEKEK